MGLFDYYKQKADAVPKEKYLQVPFAPKGVTANPYLLAEGVGRAADAAGWVGKNALQGWGMLGQGIIDALKGKQPLAKPVGNQPLSETNMNWYSALTPEDQQWKPMYPVPGVNTDEGQAAVAFAPTPQPTPREQQQQVASAAQQAADLFRFAFEKYKNRIGFQPQQPPTEIGELIRRSFPNEATTAGIVAASENASWNPKVKDNENTNGTKDRGIFQINEPTFNGLMARKGDKMRALGINSYEDMYDAAKNIAAAKLIRDEGGWGRWYGWQNKGYDLLNGYYNSPYAIQMFQSGKWK